MITRLDKRWRKSGISGGLIALLITVFTHTALAAELPLVHSRDDLLNGVILDRFYPFDHPSREWSGDGLFEGGTLYLASPFGGEESVEVVEWQTGERWAMEMEARFDGGPLDAEFGLILDYQNGSGVRVRFSNDGRFAVDKIRPPSGLESIQAWTPAPGLARDEWNKVALRRDRTRLSIVVGGEELIVVSYPPTLAGQLAVYVSPGSRYEFDHVALFRAGIPPPPTRGKSREDTTTVYFESFAVGRDDWSRNLYPVREGAIRVEPLPEEDGFDLLASWKPDFREFEAVIIPEYDSVVRIVLGATESEAGLDGLVWRTGGDGESELFARSEGEWVSLLGPATAHEFVPGKPNSFIIGTTDSTRFYLNDEPLFALPAGLIGNGQVGVAAAEDGRFALHRLVFSLAPGTVQEDTVGPAARWHEIRTLREKGAHATAVDRMRELYLLHPKFHPLLDLIYREAVRGGDLETAVAAAAAIRLRMQRPGQEEAQLAIMALLLAGRFEEAEGELHHYRARYPYDHFGLENLLLLHDRTGDYAALLRNYRNALAGSEQVRATSHGVAAWAYYKSGIPEKASGAIHTGLRLGPGRLDLTVVEGDILWARGDVSGALARYSKLLASTVTPIPEENLNARIGLVQFETGDYAASARTLADLSPSTNDAVRRARSVIRAISLFKTAEERGESGRAQLEEALFLAESGIRTPPEWGDAILFDLSARIRLALAVLDLQAGASYQVYRGKRRAAFRFFESAAALDPGFAPLDPEKDAIPDLDPTRFRLLINLAKPKDHPVGGFIENPGRWYSWYVVERRADLAERALERRLLSGDWAEAGGGGRTP